MPHLLYFSHMKYIFPLLFIGSLIVPSVAKADIAPDPGFHRTYRCAFIDNLSDFPDYDVYATSQGRFGPSVELARPSTEIDTVLTSEYGCGSLGTPFFAINQDDQARITHATDDERGDYWENLEQNEQYFINATTSGTSNFNYSDMVQGEMPDSNPTVTFVSTYHIDTLNDSTFALRLVGEGLYDEDGKLLSEVTNATTSSSTKTFIGPYALLLASIAIGGALLARVYNTMNRKKRNGRA